MNILEATIEEFEQGAWIADLVSIDQFKGTFELGGATWTGTMVTEKLDAERYFTRVIGGKNKLTAAIKDKYYAGSVTVQVAVQDVCREAGETFGGAQTGAQLTTFQRIRGTAAQALDSIAKAFTLIWWIGRDGQMQMQMARPVGGAATGTRTGTDYDASAELVEPVGVVLGGTFDGKPIRHVRWSFTANSFKAQLYFVPFIFRSPVVTAYDSLESARVDRDNGDGTIDVIVAGRYGLTKIRLLAGVPGSKVQVRGGEEVQVGYFGGDPQKPYAVSMAQDTTATKKVARNGDSVQLDIGTVLSGAATGVVVGSSPSFSLTLAAPAVGTITSGSDRLKVGD